MVQRIFGRVIHGDGFGQSLGFPTANLDRRDYIRRKLKIKFGVYIGQAEILTGSAVSRRYLAGIVIGPTDKTGRPKLEAHLIGFRGNLYGKKMNFYLVKFLRNFQRFSSAESLKRQIHWDLKIIKTYHEKTV